MLLILGSIVVGAIAAWLAGRWMRGNGFGLGGNLIAGVLGAVAGGYLLPVAGVDLGDGLFAHLVVAFIAAAIVLLLVHLFTGLRNGQRLWS